MNSEPNKRGMQEMGLSEFSGAGFTGGMFRPFPDSQGELAGCRWRSTCNGLRDQVDETAEIR